MTKFNPEVHTLIYDDGCMIEYYNIEEDNVTIYQCDKDDESDCGFVCVDINALRSIIDDYDGRWVR
jgi:hypothetical protein